jgi:hypothetical protein
LKFDGLISFSIQIKANCYKIIPIFIWPASKQPENAEFLYTIRPAVRCNGAYQNCDLPKRPEKYRGSKTEITVKAWTNTLDARRLPRMEYRTLFNRIKCRLLFIRGDADGFGCLNR